MVRTALRSRSDDVVSVVRLADRTGIVAASVPRPVEPEETAQSAPLFVPPEAAPRRARRNVLFGCAAALFLLVGWIGGGTLGQHDAAPAVASAPVADQTPAAGPRSIDPVPTSMPAPTPTPAPAPVVDKPVTRTTRKQAAPASASSTPAQARTEPVASVSAPDVADSMTEQFRQVLALWALTNSQKYVNSNAHGAYGR